MENYYEILKVVNFADDEVIRASYKALVKKYHPDINKSVDPNIMVKINEAYEVLSNPETKKRYNIQLKQYFDLINQNKHIDVAKSDIQKNNLNGKRSNHKNIFEFSIFRFLFAIIIDVIFALIGSYFIIGSINIEGSWSYFAYIIYGAISGMILANISGMRNPVLGFIGTIITIVCMSLPYYQYMFEALLLIYGSLDQVNLFLRLTQEVAHMLLGSGVIRMLMVIATPFVTYSAVVEK